jgi:hypothetical protein
MLTKQKYNSLIHTWDSKPDLRSWEWAAQNVDYSRVANYDTEWKSVYRPDYMPYWKEVMDAAQDTSVREIWVLKCSRSGFDENAGLTTLRYHVACAPIPIMYLSGQQESIEAFAETRIKPGFKFAEDTAKKFAAARVRGLEIHFDSMSLVCSYPGSRMAFKQSGYALIIASEVSMWPEFASDMLRGRTANYAFPHIVAGSSPDPAQRRGSDEDPIFVEFVQTDQRRWVCPDPKTGNGFVFRLTAGEEVDGLKWDAKAERSDGSWDMDKVAATAHYITPDGTRIEDKDRMAIIRAGHWEPAPKEKRITVTTNERIIGAECGASDKRGYHVTRFMVPFRVGSFAHIACAFLEAKQKGYGPWRTFVYEYLAEKWHTEQLIAKETEIEGRKSKYQCGQAASKLPAFEPVYRGKRRIAVMTVDVQKDSLWWVVREWMQGGDSSLIDYGNSDRWELLREIALRHGCERVFIDNSYNARKNEVIEQCISGIMKGAVPCYGRDGLKDKYGREREFHVERRDPYEGTAKGGRWKIPAVTHNPNLLKNTLFLLSTGRDWHVWRIPEDVKHDYIAQMQSERCTDGQWVKVKAANHIWDCETMSLLSAKLLGLWTELPGMAGLEQAEQIPTASPEAIKLPKPSEPPPERCKGCGSRGMYQKNNVWMCPVCDGEMEGYNE